MPFLMTELWIEISGQYRVNQSNLRLVRGLVTVLISKGGPRCVDPSTIVGLAIRGLAIRMARVATHDVADTLPASDAGDGNRSFALRVGDRGVGNPGYFLPTSVKRDNVGLMASG